MWSFLALCLILVGRDALGSEDYCNPRLCHHGILHAACNPNRGFGPACDSNATQIDLTIEYQKQILDHHNKLRSQVATGNLGKFPSADNMLKMYWDNELAFIAGFNARQCVVEHDCRATTQYPKAGQSLAWSSSDDGFPDIGSYITEMITEWFDENINCPPQLVYRYTHVQDVVSHFSRIIQEKNARIGCAIVQYRSSNQYDTLMTCNYQVGNDLDNPIYSVGLPCAKCADSCSVGYPGLCLGNSSEVVEYF